MKREFGFTLVELLVVIAIISILAGIVIPRVPEFIAKARMARAHSEVKGIDLALTKMLTDVNRQDFRSGFFDWPDGEPATLNQALPQYQKMFYILLRKGKNAETDPEWTSLPVEVHIKEDVRRKLGDTYMDLGKDPWGQLYNFYPGPWRVIDASSSDPFETGIIPFRIYLADQTVPGGPKPEATNPQTVDTFDPENTSDTFTVGYPASKSLTMYVWSNGMNLVSNQAYDTGYTGPSDEVGLDYVGGGDDINNWDNEASWAGHYS
ncbi:MAG: type II secretion system protein [Candidatus Hydrogenedentes bacterium]|nr:type II secretion system protein [Candidatus Hydrogenedentota bacterium]